MAPSTSTRVINEGTIAVVTTKKTVAKKSKKRMQKGKKNQAVHNAVVAFEGGGGRICSSITPLMHHVPTKRYVYICSENGCTNNVQKRGVCVTQWSEDEAMQL